MPEVKKNLNLTEFIALFAFLTSLTALSIDAMLPALPAIGRSLSVSNSNDVQYVVTLFFLGMAFGEIIFGPLSDAIGRKRVILIGLLIFSFGTVMAMLAESFELLLIGRIIQGIGASGPKIGSRALIRDLFKGDTMAQVMSFIMMVFILVPMVAPALGQFILLASDWRSIFLMFLVIASVIALWFGVRQPETLAIEKRIPFSLKTIASSTGSVLKQFKIMAYTVTAGLIFGILVAYLSISQSMFEDFYNIKTGFPFYFAVLAFSIGVASLFNSQLVMRLGMQRLVIAALTGLIIFSASLLSIGLLYEGVPPFEWFMILCFLMFFCIGIIFGNINAMAMLSLGHIAGLGSSIVATISSMLAVLVSITIGWFYNATIIPMTVGFVSCAMVSLILIVLAKKPARTSSRF